MSEHFDGFVSGPRHARQNRTLRTPRNHTIETRHITGEFEGFFAGPRAAR